MLKESIGSSSTPLTAMFSSLTGKSTLRGAHRLPPVVGSFVGPPDEHKALSDGKRRRRSCQGTQVPQESSCPWLDSAHAADLIRAEAISSAPTYTYV